MKPLLKIDNKDTKYFAPYYVYDNVTQYSREKDTIETRKRITGIFYGTLGDIIVISSTCSPKDSFSKHKGKSIIMNRFRSFITKSISSNVYYFRDMNDYMNGIANLANFIRTSFNPRVFASTVEGKAVDIKSKQADIEDIYFHKTFIVTGYTKFFNKLSTMQAK